MARSVFEVSGNLLRTGKPKLKMKVFENEKSEYKGHITVVMVEVQVELGQSISYTGREINSFIVRKRLWNNRMESQVSTIQIFQKHLSSTILEIELITKIHRRKPTGSVTESTKSNGEKKTLIFSGEGEEEERRFSGLRPTAVVLRLLSVSPVIAIENQAEPGWGDWPNKIKDDRLIYLEHLISEKYTFNKAMWPGGVTTEPLLKNPKARGHRHGNKKLTRVNQSLKPKPTIKKETSSRKQRRISSYFTRSNVNTFTNEQLTEMVLVLQKQMKQMQNLLNQKKRKAHGRQSSFHTVLSRCKKQRSSHHEDQGAPIDQDFPDTHQSGVETAPVKPLASDPPTDQVVDAMERDDHEDPQSPLISQYAAHIHRQASKNMNTTPDDIPNKTVHTTTVHASEVKLSMVWKKKDTIHNSHFHCSVDHQLEPADDVAHEADIVPVSQKHISYDEVEPLFKTTNVLDTEDVDAIDNNREDVHNLVDQKSDEVNNDEQNITDQDVYVMDEETAVVHLHSQSTKTSHNGPDNGILKSPVRDETIQKPTETRTFGTLYPGRWDPPSKIYDKADHPNSPEISHILNHGLRIYDAISPDLPLSQGPIFDNTAGPSSLTAIHLRNESGLGFASHATTPNAFKATASSISPPGIGRPTSAEEKLAADDPTVDLTQTKDPPPHVPSELEDLLAMEFIASPVIPALDLITPLPQKEWDLFQQILRANMNV
ncbi:hypothetical protein YC2023_107834 [Brassica napus]